MPSIIRLKPEHRKYHIVESPLVKNAVIYSEEEIEAFAHDYLNDRSSTNRERLIMAFSSIIRHMVGRYIGTWRSLLSMEDDLITEAFIKVTDSIDKLVAEEIEGLCGTVSNRINARLAHYINANRATWAPCLATQQKRFSQGQEILISRYLEDSDTTTYVTEDEISQVDFADVIETLQLTDPIDIEIMKPENWHTSVTELAEKLNCPMVTLSRRRTALYTLLKGYLYETDR